MLICLCTTRLAGQDTGEFVTSRYQASYLLGGGEFEVKMFNNLYTERTFDGFSDFNSRNTYFSSFLQVLFGSVERWNAGFDLVYKSNYLRDFDENSPFKALQFTEFDDRLTIRGEEECQTHKVGRTRPEREHDRCEGNRKPPVLPLRRCPRSWCRCVQAKGRCQPKPAPSVW